MPYSIPADQILPLLPLPSPEPRPPSSSASSSSSNPNLNPDCDSGVPSTTGTSTSTPTPTTPPRLTINTTPPTPTSPSGDVRSPTTTRGGYIQYSPTTQQYPPMYHSRGRAGHRRSYTYMYPHHLYEGDANDANVTAVDVERGDANGQTSANWMNVANANAYSVHSTPLNNNHLPRRKSVSTTGTVTSAGHTLGSTASEGETPVANGNGNANVNGTATNVHKKPTFQLGQPDDDGSASEDENSSSDSSATSENHHANANAPTNTTHPRPSRSKPPHQHPTHQHHTHIPPHTHTRQHPLQLRHQEDEDEDERHPGLPPLKLKLKQREPSFGAVPFPRSSPLYSPPIGAAAAAGVAARQNGYPFPHTPPAVSKSQSQPQPPQTHLRVSSETPITSSNANTPPNSTDATATNPTRPTVQRTSSTPLLLLANGRPLKSSLKGSSSSPNIPFPRQSMVPSILWPDLHRKSSASVEEGEARDKDVKEGQGGGEKVPGAAQEQGGLLEPERQHTVHQRAASAPSVPSSISVSGTSSSPPSAPAPTPSSSSSTTTLPHNHTHAHVHTHHPNAHTHHMHAPHPKNVHFPSSEEGGLTTVRVFNRSARPASLSLGARPAGEETETETEGTGTEGEGWGGVMRWGGWGSGRGHSFPRVGGAGAGVRREGSLKVEMGKDTEEGADVQVDDEKSSYIPRVGAHLGDANVYLESLGFVKDATTNRTATRPLTITGTILVRNVAYQKTVAVRFTLDDWHTTNDVLAKHERSLGALPEGFLRSRSGVQKHVTDVVVVDGGASASIPAWDRFKFEIRMSDYEESMRAGRVRGMSIVARYSTDGSSEEAPDGDEGKAKEWWDNNAGENYWIGFRCVAGVGGGGKERERKRGMLVSSPPAFSSTANTNAPAAQALTSTTTATATKKSYPAPQQISASRSFPAYYSPSLYSPLSGYHRPRAHANAMAEEAKKGEYDEGRTPTQGMEAYREHQQRQEQQQWQEQLKQQDQQRQEHQAALTQSTFSRLSRLNLGRMNYAAPAGATVIGASPATSPTMAPAASPAMTTTSITQASALSPSTTDSTNTSVESTPLQTPVQGYEDELEHGHAHDVDVDVLFPDGGSFSGPGGGRRQLYMGMENGHPATVVDVEKSGTPTPIPLPKASSTTSGMGVVASTPPFSELGDGEFVGIKEGGVKVKATPPPLVSPPSSSTTATTAATAFPSNSSSSSSSLYWPWGSFGSVGGAEFSGVGVEGGSAGFDDHEGGKMTPATRPLSPPVAGLLRDIKERSMRGSSTGVGGALVPPQRRRRGTQGQQQQKHQQQKQPEKEEGGKEEADDQQPTFNLSGSSSSNSSPSGSISGSGSSTSSGSDTASSKSKHGDAHHHHHHQHRKHTSSSGGVPGPPSTTPATTLSFTNSTTAPNSSSTGSSSGPAITTPMALRPGSPHPFSMGIGSGSGNGTVSSAPRRGLGMSQSSTTATTQPSPSGPSPPRSPQQTEDAIYQAFVRQWCFAQAPGPTAGASVSVVGGDTGRRNGHSHSHGPGARGGGIGLGGAGRASTPGGSGSGALGGGGNGGNGGVSLGGVGVGVVDG